MLTAEQLIEIKQRVNKEMARRCHYGSLTEFNTQFETTPTSGKTILAEQGSKVIEGLLHIEDVGDLNIDELKQDGNIPGSFDYNTINTELDKLEQETVRGSKSSCRGACTGLCVGTCGGECSGCSNNCGGGCEFTCQKTCGSSCGTCTTSCVSGCYTNCGGSCKTGCTGSR